MDENDSNNDLVTLSGFRSPVEASLAQAWLADEGIEASLDGAATANWLNQMGADLIGARLSVKRRDLARAREVLDQLSAEREAHRDSDADESPPTPPMTRAFRAAVIGVVLFPPLLLIYSFAIVVRHRLWEPQPGQTGTDWRLYATFGLYILGLFLCWGFWRAIL